MTFGDRPRPKWAQNRCVKGKPNGLRERAAQLMVQVPIKKTPQTSDDEKPNHWYEAAKKFCGIATIHGPLLAYRAEATQRYFWHLIMVACVLLLVTQTYLIVDDFLEKPVISEVSFKTSETGLQFPLVTVCNYNSIKQSYIQKLNETKKFTHSVLNYLMQSSAELQSFYGTADVKDLEKGHAEYLLFINQENITFDIKTFFEEGGYNCEDIFKICSFAGQIFDCCHHTQPTMTSLGKCFTIDLSLEGFHRKQLSPGEYNGLHLILDSQLDEVHSHKCNETDPVFMNAFENGFRYYVHDRRMISFITTEGISVSPGSRVYSSIEIDKFIRLPSWDWGRCTDEWLFKPPPNLPYSRKNCKVLCHARHFNEICGCAPYVYNTLNVFETCAPLDLYKCLQRNVNYDHAGTIELSNRCSDCQMECENHEYHAYNSYGFGFSKGAQKWLRGRNKTWTGKYVRENFVMVSLFYRDLSYTLFSEVKGNCISAVLSQIGGTMGLCFGMSLISLAEVKNTIFGKENSSIVKDQSQISNIQSTIANNKVSFTISIETSERPVENTPTMPKYRPKFYCPIAAAKEKN
ncbi:unnamed protein product, partial [Mesorhabditis belari]|uniref:Uncharacterized protein n=1 Tax=Mesorhabditis belari TaxID=2138241 RepID=A0AAF3FHC0_9BILA